MAHTTQRFAEDSADSHQAWLWVTSLLALVYSVLVIIVRIIIKWGVFGLCDAVLAVAYLLSFVVHVCIYLGLHHGLAKAAFLLLPADYLRVSNLVFVTRFLLFPILGLSKVSVLLFVQRLFSPESKGAWLALKIAIIFVSSWAVVAPIIMCGGCRPENYLVATSNVACDGQSTRLHIIAVMESITEFVTACLPIYLCSSIQLQREHRVLVVVGFGFRTTIFPLGLYYLLTYFSFLESGHDSIGISKNLVLQEAIICYSLILATTPCLRTFVRRFNTGGIRDIVATTYGRTSERTSTKLAAATALRSIAAQVRTLGAYSIFDTFAKRSEGRQHLAFRPDLENQHWASVFRGPPQGDRNGSNVSEGIETFTTWDVQFQSAEGWEKRRAEQLMMAPRRTSVQSINFITTAQW
ncbi:hypothetical protein CAC42_6521 [Sphaceloma murrayae]|uniref:Rhodopsin domain-containing protein n=1 Tax=Sphaceloma murrayae TaxID=2082308 RepID=A0A2K1QFR4_9PEZI|nr:hypothetical protein CAC42_6521 [Sphaceloma murrayae]